MSAKKTKEKKVADSGTMASKKVTAAETTKTAAAPAKVEPAAVPAKAEPAAVPAKAQKATPPAKAEKAVPPAKAEKAVPPAKAEKATPPAVAEKAAVPAVKAKSAAPAVQSAKEPAVQGVKTPATTIDIPANASDKRNPYLPYVATVIEVIQETPLIKTLRVVLDDAEIMRNFKFEPGQVGQLSVFGIGEATFVINSPPHQKDYLQFSVMKAGEVTAAIHKLSAGDKIGVRAPLGNSFPAEAWKGKDVFFVGGGIGMAPIRTIMLHLLEHKADYGKISLLYGARSPLDMAYSYELEPWLKHKDLSTTLTIDQPFEGWEHRVGLLPNILLEIAPKAQNCVAVLCGPPIMIKFTVEALKKLNFPDEQIVTTLERRMKCGIGICGRCNLGAKYICVDGPVFTWAELKDLPPEL